MKQLRYKPVQTFTVRKDKFFGEFYKAEHNRYPGKAIIAFGGSAGTMLINRMLAEQFADAGIDVMIIEYHGKEGLPDDLLNQPVEVVGYAAEWLKKAGYIKIGVWGISMGTCLAVLAAANFPDLISCAVLVSPMHMVTQAEKKNDGGVLEGSAFALYGKPFPYAKWNGGSRLVKYFFMAAFLAVLQGLVGVGTAKLVHAEEWLGLMCGPAALSGGHGNAAAYGSILDDMGHSASVVGMAAATFGLVSGGFFGGPMAERLICRNKLVKNIDSREDAMADTFSAAEIGSESVTVFSIFEHLAMITALLGIGLLIKLGVKQLWNISLPDYAGSALLACLVANINEKKQFFKVSETIMAGMQEFTLGIFLSIAMISLKLWQLISLAVPMVVILMVNLTVTLLYLYVLVFRVCGSDFDAAIMCAGMAGHGLGASPTGFANMDSVTKKYGMSKIAYLCVTVVGGILIDWVLLVVNSAMVSLFG